MSREKSKTLEYIESGVTLEQRLSMSELKATNIKAIQITLHDSLILLDSKHSNNKQKQFKIFKTKHNRPFLTGYIIVRL